MTSAEWTAQRFKEIYREQITRRGAADLLAWLETQTDFFVAPASTKYHGAYVGGLVEHSLDVYDAMANKKEFDAETRAICTLLHDVCKTNFYKTSTYRKQNNEGKWETIPCFTVDDRFPFGHGEKSVLMITKFMSLTEEEALAIRWHMGAYDDAARGGSRTYSAALRFSSLVLELHIADMRATQ